MRIITTILAIGLLSSEVTSAGPLSLDLRTSTLGLGGGLSYQFNKNISVTASIAGLRFGMSPNSKDLSVDGNLRLFSTGASLGWHPFGSSFRVLVGLFYDGNQFDLNAALKHDVTINGIVYTRDAVGSSKMQLHYNRVAPFLGVGFDTPFWQDCSWSMFGEAGFLFQGNAKAKFKRRSAGIVSDDIAHYMEKNLENAGNKFLLNYYPVLTAGIKISL